MATKHRRLGRFASRGQASDRGTRLCFALLEKAEYTGDALGVSGIGVSKLVERLSSSSAREQGRVHGRALDDYIEAQVHGAIDLSVDVDAVIVDPAFERTSTGECLRALAAKFGFEYRLHPGFVLAPGDVPADFRGPCMIPLAERIAALSPVRDRLDAARIGFAAQTLHREPETWIDWAPPEESWQHIKQLWHVLVKFGVTPIG